MSPAVRAIMYDWSAAGCDAAEIRHRKRTWLPGASGPAGGCDWCMRTAVDLGLPAVAPLAGWAHLAGGGCPRFAPLAAEWGRLVAETLRWSGREATTRDIRVDGDMLRPLGFRLTAREAGGPPLREVQQRLAQAFRETWGKWITLNKEELDAMPPVVRCRRA